MKSSLREETKNRRIPRNGKDDYSENIIQKRRDFLKSKINHTPKHIYNNSFDPHQLKGNCEHFIGVAQVPIGLAGPLKINGDFANGDFYIPLATTEGTLVLSYNRGMHIINLSGGVQCTIVEDKMQRAPVFIFANA